MALFFVKRKKGSKVGTLLVLLLVVVTVSVTLAACGNNQQQGEPAPSPIGNQNSEQTGAGNSTGNGASNPGSGSVTPIYTCTVTVTPTATSTPVPVPTGTPTPTNTPTPSPTEPALTGNALIAYYTFVSLRDHAGWWNHNTTGTMDSLEFLEILLSYEFSGDAMISIAADILEQTVVRNFYVMCKEYTKHPCSPDSDVDVFTYIEKKQLLSARPGYILQKDQDPIENGNWNPERPNRSQLDFSDVIRHHDPLWERGFVNRPLEWANASLMYASISGATIGLGTNQVVARGGGGNTAYFLTMCQTNHWGKPRPDGYGQDEDFGVRNCLEQPGWTKKSK